MNKNAYFTTESDHEDEEMDVDDSKDGVLSKDFNIDNMLNNSRTNFGGTSRRKKSYCNTEGAQLVKKVAMLNKTHDYHNSTANLNINNSRLFGLEEEKVHGRERMKTTTMHRGTDFLNVQQNVLTHLKKAIHGHSNSRSSLRYAKTFDTPEELRESKVFKQNKSIVKYLDTSKLITFNKNR